MDQTVNKLEFGWNERGLLARAASRNTAGGAIRNEVKWQYTAFDQAQIEWQEHGGAV